MQEMDSIVEEPIKSEQGSVELADLNSNGDHIQDQTTSGQCDVNSNVAPMCNVAQLDGALNCSYDLPDVANNGSLAENTSDPERDAVSQVPQPVTYPDTAIPGFTLKIGEIYTAENITDSYKRSVNEAGSQSVYTPTFNRLLSQGFQNQFQDNTAMPTFTSTPNVQRQDGVNDDNIRASENACWLINRIEQLDSGIKALKRDVIKQMEFKINELKASLIGMIEKLSTHTTYADAIRSPKPVSITEEPSLEISQNIVDSCYTDEGYGDQSGTGVQRASSETLLKTLFVANDRENRNLQHAETTPIRKRNTQQHDPSRTTQHKAAALTQHQALAMTQHQVPAMTQHQVL